MAKLDFDDNLSQREAEVTRLGSVHHRVRVGGASYQRALYQEIDRSTAESYLRSLPCNPECNFVIRPSSNKNNVTITFIEPKTMALPGPSRAIFHLRIEATLTGFTLQSDEKLLTFTTLADLIIRCEKFHTNLIVRQELLLMRSNAAVAPQAVAPQSYSVMQAMLGEQQGAVSEASRVKSLELALQAERAKNQDLQQSLSLVAQAAAAAAAPPAYDAVHSAPAASDAPPAYQAASNRF